MATAKKSHLKNPPVVKAREEETPIPEPRLKRPLDIDDEVVTPAVDKPIDDDDAPEDVPPVEDPEEEEATLDDEELNPFGDKWEQ